MSMSTSLLSFGSDNNMNTAPTRRSKGSDKALPLIDNRKNWDELQQELKTTKAITNFAIREIAMKKILNAKENESKKIEKESSYDSLYQQRINTLTMKQKKRTSCPASCGSHKTEDSWSGFFAPREGTTPAIPPFSGSNPATTIPSNNTLNSTPQPSMIQTSEDSFLNFASLAETAAAETAAAEKATEAALALNSFGNGSGTLVTDKLYDVLTAASSLAQANGLSSECCHSDDEDDEAVDDYGLYDQCDYRSQKHGLHESFSPLPKKKILPQLSSSFLEEQFPARKIEERRSMPLASSFQCKTDSRFDITSLQEELRTKELIIKNGMGRGQGKLYDFSEDEFEDSDDDLLVSFPSREGKDVVDCGNVSFAARGA